MVIFSADVKIIPGEEKLNGCIALVAPVIKSRQALSEVRQGVESSDMCIYRY